MRVLALVKSEMQADLERILAPVGAEMTFIDGFDSFRDLSQRQNVFAVAILPARVPESDTWALCGELRLLLTPCPEVLIYATRASFQLWSGVLDAGGRDVLLEPFSANELRDAVIDAAQAFEDRRLLGTLGECPRTDADKETNGN